MLFKVNFGEDIRRFTIDHSTLSFSALETQLANLYHLPPRGFKIYYTDNEGDRVVLSSSEELNAAVSYALGQSNALRLTIELGSRKDELLTNDKIKLEQPLVLDTQKSKITSSVTTSTGTNTEAPVAAKPEPTIISSSSASTNTTPIQQSTASTSVEISTNSVGMNTLPEDRVGKIIDELDMDELLAHPKFQEKFAVILSHAISTQAFSQLLQSMLPQMRDILKESIKVTSSRGNEVTNEVAKMEFPLVSSPASSSPSSSFSNPPIVPLVSNIVGSVELNSSVLENKPEISTNVSSSQVIFTKENREPISEFTIIAEDAKKAVEKDQKPATPLLDSFLSLFKSNNSNSNNATAPNTQRSPKPLPVAKSQDQDTEEVVIPNLEELLSQLEAMGFHNREQNIKTLRFHRKFNEGLDEVIEDLLSQEAKQQK